MSILTFILSIQHLSTDTHTFIKQKINNWQHGIKYNFTFTQSLRCKLQEIMVLLFYPLCLATCCDTNFQVISGHSGNLWKVLEQLPATTGMLERLRNTTRKLLSWFTKTTKIFPKPVPVTGSWRSCSHSRKEDRQW